MALGAGGCDARRRVAPAVAPADRFGVPPEPPPPDAALREPTTTEGPGWDAVRAALIVADNCYGYRLEYCVRDRDFVDPLIQGVLDKWYGGTMPDDAQQREEVVRSSRARYTEALQTPEGLRRIEKLVENRFRAPIVTWQDRTVLIDYGFLPTTLSIYRFRIAGGASEHLDAGQWRSSEVGQAFKNALERYTNAEAVVLRVDTPSTGTNSRWTYAYSTAMDRVVVWAPALVRGAYVSAPLSHDFTPVVAGQRSLQIGQLRYDRSYSSTR